MDSRNLYEKYKNLPIEDVKLQFANRVKDINEFLIGVRESPIIVLPNLKSCVNTGTIMRICATMGISNEIVLVGQRKYAENLCVGSHHYLNINTITARIDDFPTKENNEHIIRLDWDIIKSYLMEKSVNHVIIYVEQFDESINYLNMHNKIKELNENNKNVIFVMGHETYGIPKHMLEVANSFAIYIPQYGILPSMNVSMAFSVISSEYLRPYNLKNS